MTMLDIIVQGCQRQLCRYVSDVGQMHAHSFLSGSNATRREMVARSVMLNSGVRTAREAISAPAEYSTGQQCSLHMVQQHILIHQPL